MENSKSNSNLLTYRDFNLAEEFGWEDEPDLPVISKFPLGLDWKESGKGNYVCIYYGELLATVYKKKFSEVWQIIINHEGVGYRVLSETFEMASDARARAHDILEGSKCQLQKMPKSPTKNSFT